MGTEPQEGIADPWWDAGGSRASMPGPRVLLRSEQHCSVHQLQPVCPTGTPRKPPGALRLHQLWLQPLGWGSLARLPLHFYLGPI